MNVVLVRHAQTDWNTQGREQGFIDDSLNEKGREQAKRFIKILENEKIDKIYSSYLKRCVETAEGIAKNHNLEMEIRKEIKGIYLGEMEGLTPEERKEKSPNWYEERQKDKYNIPFLGGESYADIEKRISPFLKSLINENKYRNVLLVTQECANRVIIGYLLEIEKNKIPQISHPQECIYFIDTETKKIEHEINGKKEEGIIWR